MECSILPVSGKPHLPIHFKHHFSVNMNVKLSLNEAMSSLGNKVSSNTYISLLQSCIDSNSISHGRILHSQLSHVHNPNPFVATKLITMYTQCGSLDEAHKVFSQMKTQRNIFTWTALITGYTRAQKWDEILNLFFSMMADDELVPDSFLWPKILLACANFQDFKTAISCHSIIIRTGLASYVHLQNSILSMYAKCGDMVSARAIFDRMDNKNAVTWNSIIYGYCQTGNNQEAMRLFCTMQEQDVHPGLITWNTLIASYNQFGKCDVAMELMKKMETHGVAPDVFTWTSMISGFAQNNKRNQALQLFTEMLLLGVEPNGVTIASAVSVCASLKALERGKEIHALGVKIGSVENVLVGNALIDLYSKCGNLEDGRRVFDVVSEKDCFTWNSMIAGYALAGYCGKAYDLFKKMQESSVQPNVVTWNAMISGYIQKGDEDQAMDLFQKMENEGLIKRNTASWNSLIAGLEQNGDKDKALRIFRQMQCLSTKPNSITVLSVLPACANLLAAKKVKEIHACVFRRNLGTGLYIKNSLIDTYTKSGDMESARTLFEHLSSRDIVSWNTILAGYVLHGCPDTAIDLFDRMRLAGVKPNRGTFASIILAYSLAGMVEDGKRTLSIMSKDYQILPGLEHYSAMVDLLGRSGYLEEASEFIADMTIEPDSTVWDKLLTACRVHGDIRLAIRAAEHLMKLEPGNYIVYKLLLQLYDLGGRNEDASRLRKPKKRNWSGNSIGHSWLIAKNMVHSFMTGDRLDSTSEESRVAGPSDSREKQLSIEEEEKEKIAGVHSEKLAMSFALIDSPYTSQSIRIIKNMRICRDCHKTAKIISLKYRREIYLYDSKRLHHFKNGKCSCRDYW
ncbi:hypothetical protein GIB67_013231 [Kingdonia uniflora]|uniref:DYW domain-containing protein n=1 Tax=Kingdonia uniflora TaxID=39325 RepID=A0A7J7NSV0_9MAGN|nr:hypothetical protein GIB67_013231 [Kingdonia uniflora]